MHFEINANATAVARVAKKISGGGDDVVNKDLLNAYFQDLLGRTPDPGAYSAYIGKPSINVYHAIRTSPERAKRVAAQNAAIQADKNQIASLTAKVTEQAGQIEALELRNTNLEEQVEATKNSYEGLLKQVDILNEEVVRLKKLLEAVPEPVQPIKEVSIGDLINEIFNRILKRR